MSRQTGRRWLDDNVFHEGVFHLMNISPPQQSSGVFVQREYLAGLEADRKRLFQILAERELLRDIHE
jgi:hypothetical protein